MRSAIKAFRDMVTATGNGPKVVGPVLVYDCDPTFWFADIRSIRLERRWRDRPK